MPLGSIVGGIIGQGGALAAGNAAAAGGASTLNKAEDWAKTLNAWASPWTSSGRAAQNEVTNLLGLGHLYDSGDTYGDVGVNQDTRAQDQANAFSRFKTSPDYNFRFDEGLRGLDRSAASRGMLLSGAQTKAAQEYGGNLASGEYGNYINRLLGVSGQGASSNASASGAGAGIVGQGINAFGQGQMGRASSYSNAANALASGIGNGINNGLAIAAYGMGGGFGSFGGGASAPGVGQFPGATPLSSY